MFIGIGASIPDRINLPGQTNPTPPAPAGFVELEASLFLIELEASTFVIELE